MEIPSSTLAAQIPLNDVSGPLDIRRLQGSARCEACKASHRYYCLLERRAELHCETCVKGECRFRRVVVREGDAASFSWEEVLGVDEGVARLVDANARSAGVGGVKRKFSALEREDEGGKQGFLRPRVEGRQGNVIADASLASEPASQIRTHVSMSLPVQPGNHLHFDSGGFPSIGSTWDIDEIGPWDPPIDMTTLLVDGSSYMPYVPGASAMSLSERQHSVTDELGHASDQFDGVSRYQLRPPEMQTQTHTHTPYVSHFTPAYGDDRVSNTNTHTVVGVSATPSKPRTVIEAPTPAVPDKCPICEEELNTRSEAKKHMARHTKPFLCDQKGCLRSKDGFATRNDLDRHKASVHDSSHGSKLYRCAVPGCKDPNKMWSRKDNFKAHLKRMHQDVPDVDQYLEKSVVRNDGKGDGAGGERAAERVAAG